ncbi:MAG TPA: phosphatase PAP2 family protein [Candidatus Borkfalkia stercoripullorum]|nr:phosphatase PAP2 family protein [Candidatus Borkfalkia stercoripullorum]
MDVLILKALESIRCGFLDVFFSIFTLFGEELVVAGVIAVIYICFNKEFGERAIVTVLSASCITTAVKSGVRRLRPYAAGNVTKADNFLTADLDADMSFPSGHATASSGFFAALSIRFRKAYIIAPSAVLVFLIVLSRLYLGVHYPSDVLAGLVVGIGMAFLWALVYKGFYKARLYIYLGFAALTLIPLFIPAMQTKSMFEMSAIALATAIGLIVENKFIKFEDTDKWVKRIVRLALMALIAAIPYLLLGLLPETTLWFKFLQYFVTISAAILGTPLLIKAFKI